MHDAAATNYDAAKSKASDLASTASDKAHEAKGEAKVGQLSHGLIIWLETHSCCLEFIYNHAACHAVYALLLPRLWTDLQMLVPSMDISYERKCCFACRATSTAPPTLLRTRHTKHKRKARDFWEMSRTRPAAFWEPPRTRQRKQRALLR